MPASLSAVRTGSFVLLGVAALVVGIFLVGRQEGLFHPTFTLNAYFSSVEGVRAGSAIRMAGVDVGTVETVEVLPTDAKVRVQVNMDARMRGFIKDDSFATIVPEGLVGNYYIDITVGSRDGRPLDDGDVLQTRETTRLSDLLDTGGVILENIRHASKTLDDVLANISQGRGTLGKLVASDEGHRHLLRMSNRADSGLTARLGDIERLSGTVQGVAQKTDTLLVHLNSVVARVDAGDGTLGALIGDRAVYDSLLLAVTNTVRATEEARVGAGRFAENMEALKHNWFFKGYFEDRGYWDEAELNAVLDRKIDSLNTLQQSITAQMEELNRRNESAPVK